MRFFIAAGGLLGFLGIAARAYEVHGLMTTPGMTELRIHAFGSGAEILIVQGLALLALAAVAPRLPRVAGLAGALFLAGALLFALPVAHHGVTGASALLPIAPIGGALLMAGWLTLLVGGLIGLFIGGSGGARDPI
jgi:uncharacterized membrane protein YgdD (TMEM256/DUF423 family)